MDIFSCQPGTLTRISSNLYIETIKLANSFIYFDINPYKKHYLV